MNNQPEPNPRRKRLPPFGEKRANPTLQLLPKRPEKNLYRTLTVSEFQSSELFSETALSSQPGCPETAFYGLGRRHEVPT